MLKKAGIAVTATAAALLAMSPLAFADGANNDHHEQTGLVNLQDNVIQANVCDNNVNVLGIQVSDITAALGLLSEGHTSASDDDKCENESDN